MNAHFFDTPSQSCPICRRAGTVKPHRLLSGLLTCQSCRESLVVSWSGHYVRDPFVFKSLSGGNRLRQQSHPLARIWRDLKFSSQPLLLGALGSAVVVGGVWAFWQGATSEKNRWVQQPSSTVELQPFKLQPSK